MIKAIRRTFRSSLSVNTADMGSINARPAVASAALAREDGTEEGSFKQSAQDSKYDRAARSMEPLIADSSKRPPAVNSRHSKPVLSRVLKSAAAAEPNHGAPASRRRIGGGRHSRSLPRPPSSSAAESSECYCSETDSGSDDRGSDFCKLCALDAKRSHGNPAFRDERERESEIPCWGRT